MILTLSVLDDFAMPVVAAIVVERLLCQKCNGCAAGVSVYCASKQTHAVEVSYSLHCG